MMPLVRSTDFREHRDNGYSGIEVFYPGGKGRKLLRGSQKTVYFSACPQQGHPQAGGGDGIRVFLHIPEAPELDGSGHGLL
jgi:hypothetical protein